MKNFIDGVDFVELEPMKYWSFTAGTSEETKRTTVRNAIFSGDYLGALKVDGAYQRLIKDEDGNCFMISRSRNVKGEVVDKYEWVPQIHEWMAALPNGTCFLAEAYLPDNEGSKNVTSILGCLKDKAISRQQKTPLHFHIFDCMASEGKSYLNMPYVARAKQVYKFSMLPQYQNNYVHYAEFYTSELLWTKLQEYLADGREGMVIMRKDAIVYQKRTPARVSIKVKRELHDTIDCFFTGRATAPTKQYTGKELATWQYWENLQTGEKIQGQFDNDYYRGASIMPVTKSYFYNYAGSLEIGVLREQNGASAQCGDRVINNYIVEPIGFLSGLCEDIKANFKDYAFQPIEVTAMEIDSESHSLRHGKLVGFRTDLDITDCTYEKFMANR